MANPEHVEILKQGWRVWNRWLDVHTDVWPILNGADLRDADLRKAIIAGAVLRRGDLGGADFTDILMSNTAFVTTDLSKVKGLETARHFGPSSIGIDTIYQSRGNMEMVKFLKLLLDFLVEVLTSLLNQISFTLKPIYRKS